MNNKYIMKKLNNTQKVIIIFVVVVILVYLLRNNRENLNSISCVKTCLTNYSKKVYKGTPSQGEPDWSKNLVCDDGSVPTKSQQSALNPTYASYHMNSILHGGLANPNPPKPSLATLQKQERRIKCQTACDASLSDYNFQLGGKSLADQKGSCIESCVRYTSKCTMILPEIGNYGAVVGWVAHQSDDVECE